MAGVKRLWIYQLPNEGQKETLARFHTFSHKSGSTRKLQFLLIIPVRIWIKQPLLNLCMHLIPSWFLSEMSFLSFIYLMDKHGELWQIVNKSHYEQCFWPK